MKNQIQKECLTGSMQQQDLELIIESKIDFEKYKNTTVLITGATGFIGSSLVKTFLCGNLMRDLNIHIIAAVRNLEKAEKVFGILLER